MAELIVPPSLRERHIAAFDRFVKTREASMLGRRVELTGMRADGSEFPVELALSQVKADPVLICGALRDISARNRPRTICANSPRSRPPCGRSRPSSPTSRLLTASSLLSPSRPHASSTCLWSG